jgi:hypothetical protein
LRAIQQVVAAELGRIVEIAVAVQDDAPEGIGSIAAASEVVKIGKRPRPTGIVNLKTMPSP